MKIFLLFIASLCFVACGDDKATSPDSGPNLTNVQNVNGNMPDTSSGLTLDSRTNSDSTHRQDSVPH